MKNKALVWMCGLLSAIMAFTSCTNFLEEDPKTFLSPSEYYTTENQIKAAVDDTMMGNGKESGYRHKLLKNMLKKQPHFL